ncbi:asparagine synthetase B family protein, partial [Thermodesulfobacteriota bacterium]
DKAELCEKAGCSGADDSIPPAQVFVELYKRQGIDFVKDLRGAFAFAVVDLNEKRLFLAKDRFGVKPLFYAVTGSGILFGSEIKSLLASGLVEREIDLLSMHNYLSYLYIPYPATIYKSVRKVPPASTVHYKSGTVTSDKFTSLPFMPKVTMSYEDCKRRLRELVEESARLMIPASGDFGCLISGGVDSTIITGLLTKMTGRSLPAFSIGFDVEEYNEMPFAEETAKRFGCEFNKLVVKPEMIDVLPKLVRHYEEPYGDSSALPTFYVLQMAREQVKTAFLGDGGDDSFAGYLRYWATRIAAKYDIIPHALVRPIVDAILSVYPKDVQWRSLAGYGRRFLEMLRMPLEDRYGRLICPLTNAMKESLYTDDFAAEVKDFDSLDFVRGLFCEPPKEYDMLDRTLYTDLSSYMPGDLVVKVEVAAATAGIVTRAPLLDDRVVDFAASLPADYKLKGRNGKHILKETFGDLLTREILERRKTGFGAPIEAWFKKDLYDYLRDHLLNSKLPTRGYFRRDAIERMIEDHRNSLANNTYPLWNLLMLELWHQEFIDG